MEFWVVSGKTPGFDERVSNLHEAEGSALPIGSRYWSNHSKGNESTTSS